MSRKKKPTYLERFIREESSQRAPPYFVDGGRWEYKLDGLLRTEGHMPLLYALHGTTTPRMSVYIEVGYRKVKISVAPVVRVLESIK